VLLKCVHFFVNRFAGLGAAEGHLMKKKINHGFGQQLVKASQNFKPVKVSLGCS